MFGDAIGNTVYRDRGVDLRLKRHSYFDRAGLGQ
jgi:hypothetical protein